MQMEIKDVTQSIFEILSNRILTSQLKDGERLNENQLATEHNISRGPLREAFRLLEKEGLVTSIPRKGTFVKELHKRDIEEVIVANDLKDYQLQDTPLIALEDLPPQTYEDPTHMLPILMDNFRFHISLVEASGNQMLVNFYQTITSISARCQFKFPYSKENLERTHREHKELAALMRAEEYVEAKAYLKGHLHNALASLLNSYELEYLRQQAAGG
jgi:DNA-binding GntR family transcriptional regulator